MKLPLLALAVLASLAAAVIDAPRAGAAVEWDSKVFSAPTHLPPGGEGDIRVLTANAGDSDATDFPTVSFELPPGVVASATKPPGTFGWTCAGTTAIACSNSAGPVFGVPAHTKPASGPGSLALPLDLIVEIAPGAPEGAYPFEVTLSGGGGPAVTETHRLIVSSEPVRFGIAPGTLAMGAFDQGGAPYTEAGGHPYLVTTRFELNTRYVPVDPGNPSTYFGAIRTQGGGLKDTIVDLPAGLVSNPNAVPKCPSLADVRNRSCPDASQVGVTTFEAIGSFGRAAAAGIYNVEPPDDAPGQLAFMSPLGQVVLEPSLRSDGDHGLSVRVRNLTEVDDILAMTFTLWGVPAHPSHDSQRCSMPNEVAMACVGHDEVGDASAMPGALEPHTSSVPEAPFLTVPTACGGEPLVTRVQLDGWAAPGALLAGGNPDPGDPRWASATAGVPPLVRCDRLQFAPSVVVQPTSHEALSPTGLRVEVEVPQNEDPRGFATAHLKDATVLLPEGMTLNPSAADGLGSCSPREAGLVSPPGRGSPAFDRSPPSCPLSSKIGTARVDTPLLGDPLQGGVYLARQGDNPFGSLLALYVFVEGAGTPVKLAGRVRADPGTGRLSIAFLGNPQIPFERIALAFKSGPRAPLVTPGCGAHAADVGLASWAAPGTETAAGDSFRILQGPGGRACPAGAPEAVLSAGTVSPIAGDPSPFVVDLSREDGAMTFAALELLPPRGIAAKLAGVPYCPEAALSAAGGNAGLAELAGPACPASQVGTAAIAAGAGSRPLHLGNGRVYLAGPHRGGPLSLAIVVPALAGPLDLGTVMVRASVHVDPGTARLTIRSDPMPTILQGIPLNVRNIRIALDRPGFMRNPTSCRQMRVDALVHGTGGSSFSASVPFQARACRALPFRPRLKLSLRGPTHRSAHPSLRAVLRARPGDANIGRLALTLPRTEFFENAHIDAVCTQVRYAARACPRGSIYGYARAWSPLLDAPLKGPVYLRSSSRELPDLVAALDGQIRIDLIGRVDTAGGRIRNTFDAIPDVPFGKFALTMKGGRKALLVNNTELCRAEPRVRAELVGHNGKRSISNPLVKVDCGKGDSRRR